MDNLSDYLTQNKITQAKFAERVGVTQAQISRLTSGRSQPSAQLAFQISAATGGAVPVCAWRAFRMFAESDQARGAKEAAQIGGDL